VPWPTSCGASTDVILVLIPAVLVAAASVAGHAGASWWMLDLLSNFRPQYAVSGVLLGLGLIVGKWRKTGGVVLVVGLVDCVLVGMLWLAPSSPAAPVGEEITVMSFNVWASNEGMEGVFDYVRRVAPDVVFLHETTYLWEDAALAADLGYEVHTAGQRGLIFSTMVLAPKGASVESYGFATAEPRAIEVVLDHADRTTRILGLHPISPVTSERAALRNAQMRWAAEWVRAADGPTIVTGDFNTTQFSHAWRTLVRETGLRDSTRGFGLQPSFPMNGNPLVRVQIDHLLHSDDFVTVDRTLGPRLGSDHAPLIVRLAPVG
jgi:endonuclease/exonuclease/phosphatase (EEP) superfamily protein YafD